VRLVHARERLRPTAWGPSRHHLHAAPTCSRRLLLLPLQRWWPLRAGAMALAPDAAAQRTTPAGGARAEHPLQLTVSLDQPLRNGSVSAPWAALDDAEPDISLIDRDVEGCSGFLAPLLGTELWAWEAAASNLRRLCSGTFWPGQCAGRDDRRQPCSRRARGRYPCGDMPQGGTRLHPRPFGAGGHS
jgi:hypothetical protein